MAVIYDASVKTARMTAVKTEVGASGKLKIRDSANNILCTIGLGAGGSVSGAVWTFIASATSGSASGAGAAHNAIITTSADASKVTGLTVGTSGADVILDNLVIASGQTVTINSGTLTHAA